MQPGKLLILVGGHPYSGRAELARAVADALGAKTVGFERVARSATMIERYRAFTDRVRDALRSHHTVVAVAPLYRRSRRADLLEAMQDENTQIIYVECTCSVEAMQRRVMRQYASAAPAFLELRLARAMGQRRGYQPLGTEVTGVAVVPINGDLPIGENVQRVLSAVAGNGQSLVPEQREAGDEPYVFVVDDDGDLVATLRDVLETAGCHVSAAQSGREALAWAASSSRAPDLVLLDYKMPDATGLELAPTLRQKWPDVEIVLLTAYDEPWLCDEAFREHVDEYLCKPVRAGDLFRLVDRVAHR